MFGLTPEDLENEVGESLTARTAGLASIRSLGPADLVELQKVTKGKVSSMYHFVTGVDVSSAAAIAAYLTTLTSPLGEAQLWFGRAPGWRVIEGTYCSYNVFSKLDVRVTASFPGGTRMYVVTPEGLSEEVEAASPVWSELYMSAMMRCLLLKDDDIYYMENTRHEFPFDPAGVRLFLATFAELYPRSFLAGAGPWVQTPSLDCNHMVDALLVLLEATGEYAAAVEMLGRIEAKEVMAQVLLKADQEVNAVSLLVDTARRDPRNARILALEAEFCLAKNKLDLALDCAKRAVAAKPSDFYPWEILCKVYIAQEQWSEALLALNSTPLIPMTQMDTLRMPPSKKVHRPLPQDGVLDEAWQFTSDKRNLAAAQLMSIGPVMARLPAAQLRGSTARAYALLATINAKIGWNELMRLRGEVFWMEAEGEAEASREDTGGRGEESREEGEQSQADGGDAREDARENGEDARENGEDTRENGEDTRENGEDTRENGENTRENGENTRENGENTRENGENTRENGEESGANEESRENGEQNRENGDRESDGGAHNTPNGTKLAPGQSGTTTGAPTTRRSLRSKRLCERRIDRLFLILYEDVRAYSTWQREVVHFESQQLPFEKSALEWQVFGSVAQRLLHHDQAKRAYVRSLSMYFNHKALARELEYDPLNIEIIVKLMAWNHRWYNEFSPSLMGNLRALVARDGITKVRYEVEARFNKESVVDLIKIELGRLAALQVPGYDM